MNSTYRNRSVRRILGALGVLALATVGLGVSGGAASADPVPQVYVALGDSMASGPLIPLPTGPLACGRSTQNYAHDIAARLGVAQFRDVTCSGADTGDMTGPQSLSIAGIPMGTAPPQFDALTPDTTLVTVTIGGNDAGLIGVAQKCVNLNPFATPCRDTFVVNGVDTVAQRIDAFSPKFDAVLDGIHQRSPNARVVVTGYGLYVQPGGCWPVQPLLAVDADWLQGEVDYLDAVIAREAGTHGAEYVDLLTPSAGHDSCQAESDRWVEGYLPLSLAAPLHPNVNGETNYGRIIGDQIAGG